MKKELGQVIRRLRKAKGLTQEDLGAIFNIDSGNVSRWESGENTPDFARLALLAKTLGVGSVSGLIGMAETGATDGTTGHPPSSLDQVLEALSGYLLPLDAVARRRAGGLLADLADDPASHASLAGILRAVIDSAKPPQRMRPPTRLYLVFSRK